MPHRSNYRLLGHTVLIIGCYATSFLVKGKALPLLITMGVSSGVATPSRTVMALRYWMTHPHLVWSQYLIRNDMTIHLHQLTGSEQLPV